jgi:3-oxoacyl-[acyl-carrier protein] reductase
MRLDDLVAVVTGASHGIGVVLAERLAAEGAAVVVVGRSADAEDVARGLPKAIAVRADVTVERDVEAMTRSAVDAFGRIDILVNNAGGARLHPGPFWEITETEWDEVVDVNLKGVWLCTKAAFPIMRANGSGKVINIVSRAVQSGSPGLSPYAAAKSGAVGLTLTLARELAPYNITVNAVGPGAVGGDVRIKPYSEHEWGALHRRLMERQLIQSRKIAAEDVAAAVAFFASPEADLITGQVLIVDGGAKLFGEGTELAQSGSET